MLIFKVMKRNLLKYLFILISGLIISCSNTPNSKILTNEEDTLRAYLTNKESTINWTKALEDNRLVEKIDSREGITSGIKLNPDLVKIKRSECEPVYPYIENFANLDTRYLISSWKNTVDSFVKLLNENEKKDAENLIDPKFAFNYIFFISDFEEYVSNIKYLKVSEDEMLIKKYIIGEPFISKEIIQIPVRLFIQENHIDIAIYINNNGKGKISQIEILNWER